MIHGRTLEGVDDLAFNGQCIDGQPHYAVTKGMWLDSLGSAGLR